MKKIALFTPKIYYILLKKHLNEKGFDVLDYSYDFVINKNIITKFLTSHILKYSYYKQFLTFNKLIGELINKLTFEEIDLILFFKGQKIKKEFIDIIKTFRIPIIFWSTDSLSRFPHINCQYISNINFFQDGGDCITPKDKWLPLGIDSKNFYLETKKKYDITFVGRTKGKKYKTRRKYMKLLLRSHLNKQYNINVISNFSAMRYLYYKIRYPQISFYRTLKYKLFAEFIRKSKIVINIHQDDGYMPINPLFFSIPYSHTLQITDDRKYYDKWLNENLFCKSSPENFINIIKHCLEDYHKMILNIDKFYGSLKTHTFKNRINYILVNINNLLSKKNL